MLIRIYVACDTAANRLKIRYRKNEMYSILKYVLVVVSNFILSE